MAPSRLAGRSLAGTKSPRRRRTSLSSFLCFSPVQFSMVSLLSYSLIYPSMGSVLALATALALATIHIATNPTEVTKNPQLDPQLLSSPLEALLSFLGLSFPAAVAPMLAAPLTIASRWLQLYPPCQAFFSTPARTTSSLPIPHSLTTPIP